MFEKYIKRLNEAATQGFRGCVIDAADELEVQQIFFYMEHFYFFEEDEKLCLTSDLI